MSKERERFLALRKEELEDLIVDLEFELEDATRRLESIQEEMYDQPTDEG